VNKQENGKKVLRVSSLLTIGLGLAVGCSAAGRTALWLTNKVSSGARKVKVSRAINEKVNRVLARKAFLTALSPQRVVGLHILDCIVVEVTTGILINRVAKYRSVLISAKETCEEVKKPLP
jgi:hypothetical protein